VRELDAARFHFGRLTFDFPLSPLQVAKSRLEVREDLAGLSLNGIIAGDRRPRGR